MYTKIRENSIATVCHNFIAIGKERSEIYGFKETYTHIFTYISC